MTFSHFLTPTGSLLGAGFPLPLDRPFTTAEARAAGLSRHDLTVLVERGLLRRLVRGVYAVAQLPDTADTRMQAVGLVVPPDAVVTDDTACWVYAGGQGLAPNAHLSLQRVTVFRSTPGYRLAGPLHRGGERTFEEHDLTVIQGVQITTPLRTALDAARIFSRIHAQAMVDVLMRHTQLSRDDLVAELDRFRGYRGVRQARVVIPDGDGRSESWGESAMRRRWLDTPGLPRPELQIPVDLPDGRTWRVDLGVDELRFGGEYDGREHHGPDQAEHDTSRRDVLKENFDWVLVIGHQGNVLGRQRDIEFQLMAAYRRSLERAHRLKR